MHGPELTFSFVAQVRRPSLPPGRGSLSDMTAGGSFRQLSTHPSHALPTPASPPDDGLFSGALAWLSCSR